MEDYIDQAPCIFFSVAVDGTLLSVNEKLCASLGYTKSELLHQKADTIFTLPTRIFQQTHFFPLLKMQGHAEEIFITLRKKDGEFLPVLINAERKVIDEEAVHLYVGIVVHNRQKYEEELISAKKTAEKALNENLSLVLARQELQTHIEALDQQLQVINKQNEELKQFSRVVTHDLQEPLRKLAMYSGMLQKEPGEADHQKGIERVRRATEQMKTVITGLQQYVWLNDAPLNLCNIALDKLLQEVGLQLAEEFAGVDVSLNLHQVQVFDGDWDQMQLLFYELLSNVIRFRKEGQKAVVSISMDVLQRNSFRTVAAKYKYVDYLRIQVQDQGIGFNPEYKEQVFELFKTLHKEAGRGLGLSLCQKVVHNHLGEMTIDSIEGQGTTVTIFFPYGPVALKELKNIEEAPGTASKQNSHLK